MKRVLLLVVVIAVATCYSKSIAHDLAHIQSITYESLATINAWNCSECAKYSFKNQKGFFSSVANIQGFAGYDVKNHAVVVAFRGSVDFKNWLYNLDTVSTSYPGCSGCSVHSGFYSAYKGVSSLVRAEVDRLLPLYPTAKLYITGHSLGGAMAIHCALHIKEFHGKVDQVYTFGQPRVGNSAFATFYQTQIPNTNRVINYADMVPHVPPASFGFFHGGHEIWYTPRGMTTYKQCVSQDKTCANSVVGTALNTDDHSLTVYMTLSVNSTQVNNLKRQDYDYTSEQIQMMEARRIQQIKQLYESQQSI